MPATDDMFGDPRLRAKLHAARIALFWERLWLGLWPTLAVVGLFLVVSLFDLWAFLPRWLHFVGLALFAAAVASTLYRSRGIWRLPSAEAAMARLERDSGVAHQPLRAALDALAVGEQDPWARHLWRAHRARLAALLGTMRPRLPRSPLPRRDPWALRALLVLLLVVALVEARGRIGERLGRAFLPPAEHARTVGAPGLEVWFTPPAYTRRAPFRLDPTAWGQPVRVPTGSIMRLQVHHLADGSDRPPVLITRDAKAPFTMLGAGSAEARYEVKANAELEVRLGGGTSLARLAVAAIPDEPPSIRFVDAPRTTLRGALDVRFEARDDYGLAEIALVIEPPAPNDEPGEAVERHVLVRPAKEPPELASRSFLDLTSHPRAGLPVVLRLEAVDAAGNRATSGPLEITLPERSFTHPLAKAVIEQRKRLVERPARWALVARRLRGLAATREALALGASVPLSLDVAAARLERQRSSEGRRSVVDLLWEIALFIEDGALSIAERRLRELQDKLQRALLEGAQDRELEQLVQQLQEALDRYLAELARRATEQMQRQAPDGRRDLTALDPQQLVRRDDLMAMLRKAEELMKSGMRDAARKLLSELQNMLENLQAAAPRTQPTPGEQALGDLQRMIELQRQLLDRSFELQRRMREGRAPTPRMPPQTGRQGQRGEGQARPRASGRAAMEQEALRRALGELMRRLGEAGMEIPRALGKAELQMRQARRALEKGAPGRAAEPQSRALDFMQQGGQAMLEQLREQMAKRPGGGQPGLLGRRGRDPLGRALRNEGGFQSDGVQLPSDYDLGRARGVLEELYRRSGERRRPRYELEYYKRLLDRF